MEDNIIMKQRLISFLEIKGDGVNIAHKDIPYNEFGETECRFNEDGEIERFCFSAHSLDGTLLDYECHTWDETGKHLRIFYGENLSPEERIEKEVEVDLPKGKKTLKVVIQL